MAGIFPLRYEVEAEPDGRTSIDIAGEDASMVFSALASETARAILTRLNDAPETASGIAESVDTSLQNVLHHLGSLREADLIRVVDTWYSSRGAEMKVYAPAYESLLVVAGNDGDIDVAERATRTATVD